MGPIHGQELADRILVGYWHNWAYPNAPRLIDLPVEFDVVNVAFAVPSTPLGADLEFHPTPAIYPNSMDFLADVQSLQASGRKVLISIGGGADPIQIQNAADEALFVASLLNIVQTWGFDGVDIDLEGSSLELEPGDVDFRNPITPRIVHFIQGMQAVMAQLPVETLLSAAPETAFVQGGYGSYGGVWGAYLPVLDALRDELDYVHVQHYNSGTMFGRDGQIYTPGTADFHVAMAESLLAGFDVAGGGFFPPFRSDQVAIGLPASPLAAGSGYTPPATVTLALDYLYLGSSFGGQYQLANPNGYPGFRGLMTWSINWDMWNGEEFASEYDRYLRQLFLAGDVANLSVTTGGVLNLQVKAGAGNAGRAYVLVGSASGTDPGLQLPGGSVTLPLNRDAFMELSYWQAGLPTFPGFQGTLDGQGQAMAQFHLPPVGSHWAGRVLHFAYGLSQPWDFASQPVALVLDP